MPGILNDASWSMWGYQVEGLRTFEADGAKWMWRDADVRAWSSSIDPERRYGTTSAGFVIGSAIMAIFSVAGIAFGIVHGIANFTGASILAFSAVTYVLMWTSYFLFARRLRGRGLMAEFLSATQGVQVRLLPSAPKKFPTGKLIWRQRRAENAERLARNQLQAPMMGR